MSKSRVLQNLILFGLTIVAILGVVVTALSKSQVDVYPALSFLTGQPPQDVLIPQAYISGAVVVPGVYRIDDQTRIGALIKMAGGVSTDVDTNYIAHELNLAKIVQDEEHVFIPAVAEQAVNISAEAISAGGLVNLNTASVSQLESLPGIGTSLAEQIIAHRPFNSISQLQDVPGIGDAKYSKLLDLVSI